MDQILEENYLNHGRDEGKCAKAHGSNDGGLVSGAHLQAQEDRHGAEADGEIDGARDDRAGVSQRGVDPGIGAAPTRHGIPHLRHGPALRKLPDADAQHDRKGDGAGGKPGPGPSPAGRDDLLDEHDDGQLGQRKLPRHDGRRQDAHEDGLRPVLGRHL